MVVVVFNVEILLQIALPYSTQVLSQRIKKEQYKIKNLFKTKFFM